MRKFLSMLVGLSIGSVIGALLVTFFSPVSSSEFRDNWEAHYQRALEAAAERQAQNAALTWRRNSTNCAIQNEKYNC